MPITCIKQKQLFLVSFRGKICDVVATPNKYCELCSTVTESCNCYSVFFFRHLIDRNDCHYWLLYFYKLQFFVYILSSSAFNNYLILSSAGPVICTKRSLAPGLTTLKKRYIMINNNFDIYMTSMKSKLLNK